jgi:hypothetical protein
LPAPSAKGDWPLTVDLAIHLLDHRRRRKAGDGQRFEQPVGGVARHALEPARAELLGIQPAAQARLPISGSRLGRRR